MAHVVLDAAGADVSRPAPPTDRGPARALPRPDRPRDAARRNSRRKPWRWWRTSAALRATVGETRIVTRGGHLFDPDGAALTDAEARETEARLRERLGADESTAPRGVVAANPGVAKLAEATLRAMVARQASAGLNVASVMASWIASQTRRHRVEPERLPSSLALAPSPKNPRRMIFVLANPRSGSTSRSSSSTASRRRSRRKSVRGDAGANHCIGGWEKGVAFLHQPGGGGASSAARGARTGRRQPALASSKVCARRGRWMAFAFLHHSTRSAARGARDGFAAADATLRELDALDTQQVYDVLQGWAGERVLVDKTPTVRVVRGHASSRRGDVRGRSVRSCIDISATSRPWPRRRFDASGAKRRVRRHQGHGRRFERPRRFRFVRLDARNSRASRDRGGDPNRGGDGAVDGGGATLGARQRQRIQNSSATFRPTARSSSPTKTSSPTRSPPRARCARWRRVPYREEMANPYAERNAATFAPAAEGGLGAGDPHMRGRWRQASIPRSPTRGAAQVAFPPVPALTSRTARRRASRVSPAPVDADRARGRRAGAARLGRFSRCPRSSRRATRACRRRDRRPFLPTRFRSRRSAQRVAERRDDTFEDEQRVSASRMTSSAGDLWCVFVGRVHRGVGGEISSSANDALGVGANHRTRPHARSCARVSAARSRADGGATVTRSRAPLSRRSRWGAGDGERRPRPPGEPHCAATRRPSRRRRRRRRPRRGGWRTFCRRGAARVPAVARDERARKFERIRSLWVFSINDPNESVRIRPPVSDSASVPRGDGESAPRRRSGHRGRVAVSATPAASYSAGGRGWTPGRRFQTR